MENALPASSSGRIVATCLRFATACGMSDRLRPDLVLNDFVASAPTTKDITVLSNGTPWRPLIDEADMSRAIEWVIGRSPERGGEVLVVNVGHRDGNYQAKDLAGIVASEPPGTKVSINNREASPDLRSHQVDFSLFSQLAPAHVPAVPLPLRNLFTGLGGMGFSDREFRAPPLIRLKTLKDISHKSGFPSTCAGNNCLKDFRP